MNEKWTAPSRKWMVTQITALAALATAYIQAGDWSTTLSVMAVGIVSQALIGYLVPNTTADTERQLRAQRGQMEPLTILIYVIVIVILIAVLFAVLDRI